MSHEELKKQIKLICQHELKQHKVFEQDVEGFINSLVYNPYGQTDFDKIAPQIYQDVNK